MTRTAEAPVPSTRFDSCRRSLFPCRTLFALALTAVCLCAASTPAWAANDLTVTGGSSSTDYAYNGNVLIVKTSAPMTISGTTTTDTIVVDAPGADVTLDGVDIDVSGVPYSAALTVHSGSLTLTLADGSTNVLKSGEGRAGLQNTELPLIIQGGSAGTGSLVAAGGNESAGIGAGMRTSASDITILGGRVTALAGKGGAGIGGGTNGSGERIRIQGGAVWAVGNGGAGIGGGTNGPGGAPGLGIDNVIDGNAWVVSSPLVEGIDDGMTYAKGVVFLGNEGTVHGLVDLPFNAEIETGKTLTIPMHASLSLDAGVQLSNSGTLALDGGALQGAGSLDGSGRYLKYDVTADMLEVPTDLEYTGSDQTAAAMDAMGLVDLDVPVIETIKGKDFTVTYGKRSLWEFAVDPGETVKDARADYEVTCTHKDDPNRHASKTFGVAVAPVTVVGTTVSDKVFDNTDVASVTLGTVSGIVAGDDVRVLAAGSFADALVGENKVVTVTYELDGADSKNYAAPEPETVSATIAPRVTPIDAGTSDDGIDSDRTSPSGPLPDGGLASTGDAVPVAPLGLAVVGSLAMLAAGMRHLRREG